MPDRPDVVLVTIDSLRADHCGCYGYPNDTTPHLDALAADGVVYEHAVAPGPTTPDSMPVVFTGAYPDGDGDGLAATRERIRRHVTARDALPERMRRRGYATVGFTPNPWTSRYFGFDAGFDRFEDFMEGGGLWERMLDRDGSRPLALLRLVRSWLRRENTFRPWESFYGDVLAAVRDAPGPTFCWVFLLDAHFPYLADAAARTQSRPATYEANLRLYLESQQTPYSPRVHDALVTAYDDAVRYADRFLGRLRADLDDPVVMVHADHGEAFGEHGTYGHHGHLYEENVRVPLVVSGPGVDAERVADPVSLRALPSLATALADGRDPAPERSSVGTRHAGSGRLAVRDRVAKYVRGPDREAVYLLADGEADPAADAALLDRYRTLAARWAADRREREAVAAAAAAVAGGGG